MLIFCYYNSKNIYNNFNLSRIKG